MATNAPQEPNAELRELASALRQMFVALKNEGFDESQALTIIGKVLAATQGGGGSQ